MDTSCNALLAAKWLRRYQSLKTLSDCRADAVVHFAQSTIFASRGPALSLLSICVGSAGRWVGLGTSATSLALPTPFTWKPLEFSDSPGDVSECRFSNAFNLNLIPECTMDVHKLPVECDSFGAVGRVPLMGNVWLRVKEVSVLTSGGECSSWGHCSCGKCTVWEVFP